MIQRSQFSAVKLLSQLWPKGAAWHIPRAKIQQKFIDAVGASLIRLDWFIASLADEAVPYKSDRYLSKWAVVYTLPNDCTGPLTNDELRLQLLARIPNKAGHNKQDFIDLAARIGVTVTISTTHTWVWGQSVWGEDFFNSLDASYVWIVTTDIPSGGWVWGESIWGVDRFGGTDESHRLECLFSERLHSHRRLIFVHNG